MFLHPDASVTDMGVVAVRFGSGTANVREPADRRPRLAALARLHACCSSTLFCVRNSSLPATDRRPILSACPSSGALPRRRAEHRAPSAANPPSPHTPPPRALAPGGDSPPHTASAIPLRCSLRLLAYPLRLAPELPRWSGRYARPPILRPLDCLGPSPLRPSSWSALKRSLRFYLWHASSSLRGARPTRSPEKRRDDRAPPPSPAPRAQPPFPTNTSTATNSTIVSLLILSLILCPSTFVALSQHKAFPRDTRPTLEARPLKFPPASPVSER